MDDKNKDGRMVKVVSPDEEPQRVERVRRMMVALSEALLPFDPDVNEILSAINTLQALVMARSDESIEHIRKTLREAEDTIVDAVLRERGDLR